VLILVNSFLLFFWSFSRRFTGPTFSHDLRMKKGRYTGDGTGPAPGTGWAGRPGLTGPVGSRRRFASVPPGMLLFDFFLWKENFKGSLNKENSVSRVFLFGLFIWPKWEPRNPSHLAFFCTHTAAMVSPKSVELKRGAKEPSMEEAKRCELKLPVEIKRTARSRCGGHVLTGAIASHLGAHPRHEVEGLQGGVSRA
jgi:hypothetical protein